MYGMLIHYRNQIRSCSLSSFDIEKASTRVIANRRTEVYNRCTPQSSAQTSKKLVYVEPQSPDAISSVWKSGDGIDCYICHSNSDKEQDDQTVQDLVEADEDCITDERKRQWRSRLILIDGDGYLLKNNEQIGRYFSVSNISQMKEIVETTMVTCSQMQVQQDIILDFLFEWKVIPAENLVALIQQYIAAQSKPAMMIPRFFVVVSTASDALLMLTALEAGVDGVVLRTPSGSQVLNLVERMQHRQQQITQRGHQEGNGADTGMLLLTPVTVTKVVPLGSGHRVCVDLSSLMQPGEGLLVGSFSRGMFLVQSESEESEFINSRPFRVNAGPVHMYVHMPGGRTAYLSELKSGDEVMVVNSQGLQRPGLVGRVKVEARPLVLVEARGSDSQIYSLQLQNAETVKLIGPAIVGGYPGCRDALVSRMSPSSRDGEQVLSVASIGGFAINTRTPEGMVATQVSHLDFCTNNDSQATPGMSTIKELSNNESMCSADALLNSACWQAISVSELKEGDVVYTYLQEGARHTGLSISEFIIER